jgi:ATP-dependent Lon protease
MTERDSFMIQSFISDENDNQEFISLLSQEEEDEMNKEILPESLPILPLRNTVLFPGVVIPITVGRDKSINLIKDAYKGKKSIGVVAQVNATVEDPNFEDLHKVGTVAHIIKMLRMPDGNTTVIIQGKRRFRLNECLTTEPYLTATITALPEKKLSTSKELTALVSSVKDLALQIIDVSPYIPSEATIAIKNIDSPKFLMNFISSNMNLDVNGKQAILEIEEFKERSEKVLEHLTKELQQLQLKNEIQSKVRGDMDKQQREFVHCRMNLDKIVRSEKLKPCSKLLKVKSGAKRYLLPLKKKLKNCVE